MLCEKYWKEDYRHMNYIRSNTITLCRIHLGQGGKGLDPGNRAEHQKHPGRCAQGVGHDSPSCSTAGNVLAVKQSMDVSLHYLPKVMHLSVCSDR